MNPSKELTMEDINNNIRDVEEKIRAYEFKIKRLQIVLPKSKEHHDLIYKRKMIEYRLK